MRNLRIARRNLAPARTFPPDTDNTREHPMNATRRTLAILTAAFLAAGSGAAFAQAGGGAAGMSGGTGTAGTAGGAGTRSLNSPTIGQNPCGAGSAASTAPNANGNSSTAMNGAGGTTGTGTGNGVNGGLNVSAMNN